MRWLQDLAAIYIDPAVCPNAAREFAGYEYKRDRLGNFMAAFPDGEDHTIDATRYALEEHALYKQAKIGIKALLGL